MRISDWSSDVCSSDLFGRPQEVHRRRLEPDPAPTDHIDSRVCTSLLNEYASCAGLPPGAPSRDLGHLPSPASPRPSLPCLRSEERRAGKECVITCRSRWSLQHEKKNNQKKTHK